MAGRAVGWDLRISGGQPELLPLRPRALYRSPLPRTKLAASVPDCLVNGTIEVDARPFAVSGWRGTVGHNWGSEHADRWVWLHGADFGGAPDCWLELVLARIRIGPARSPWTAMGAISLGGERIPLGGLGRRPRVDGQQDRLTASITSPGGRLRVRVTTAEQDAVAVAYQDPSGGSRAVRHAAIAAVELALVRKDGRELALSTSRGAYEFGTSQGLGAVALEPLPEG